VGAVRIGIGFEILVAPALGDEFVGSIADLLVEVDEPLVGIVDTAVVWDQVEGDGASAKNGSW